MVVERYTASPGVGFGLTFAFSFARPFATVLLLDVRQNDVAVA
jgi:hypothetical protein